MQVFMLPSTHWLIIFLHIQQPFLKRLSYLQLDLSFPIRLLSQRLCQAQKTKPLSLLEHIRGSQWGLTVSRQTAENFTINRQKCRLILTVKGFKVFQSHYFSWSLRTSGSAHEEYLKWAETRVTTFSRHYKTLQLAYISKYFEILYAKGYSPIKVIF